MKHDLDIIAVVFVDAIQSSRAKPIYVANQHILGFFCLCHFNEKFKFQPRTCSGCKVISVLCSHLLSMRHNYFKTMHASIHLYNNQTLDRPKVVQQ